MGEPRPALTLLFNRSRASLPVTFFFLLFEVTDGWYSIDAALDGALAHFLRRGKGKIAPGTKLAIANAALEAGAGPVE